MLLLDFEYVWLAFVSNQPDYILSNSELDLRFNSELPTAMLVCEQHPTFQIEELNSSLREGLGCWLSIVTSLSVLTISWRFHEQAIKIEWTKT